MEPTEIIGITHGALGIVEGAVKEVWSVMDAASDKPVPITQ
jgi:hypothetical protein